MIVAAWFTIVVLIVLLGFGIVTATFIHWYKESRKKAEAAAVLSAESASTQS